jgi:hypothetical protein
MFDNNWMLFILILILVFSGNVGIIGTELAVLIAAVLAIVLSEGGCLNNLFGCCPNNNDDNCCFGNNV